VTSLQQIAMGVLVIVLDTLTAYDALPDPLGWLLVLPAVARLPRDERPEPLAAGLVAAAVATLVWFPAVRGAVAGLDPAVAWALLLVPDVAFAALLCRALARLAGGDDHRRTAAWFRTLAVLFTLLALAPVPFLATDRSVPGDLGFALQLTWLVLVVLLFAWHRRRWAPESHHPGGLDRSGETGSGGGCAT
jgi:hypothetical protein